MVKYKKGAKVWVLSPSGKSKVRGKVKGYEEGILHKEIRKGVTKKIGKRTFIMISSPRGEFHLTLQESSKRIKKRLI